MNSRSASAAPASSASDQAGADRAARVGRALPQRRGAAGARAPSRAAGIAADSVTTPDAAAVVDPQREGGACARARRCAACGGDQLGQPRRQVPAGRAAAGVHDAAARVTALERQQQLAVGGAVERDARAPPARAPGPGASSQRISDRVRRQAPRPAASVSARCRSDAVVGGRARPPARPAPSSWPTAPAASSTRAPRARRCSAATRAV